MSQFISLQQLCFRFLITIFTFGYQMNTPPVQNFQPQCCIGHLHSYLFRLPIEESACGYIPWL